MIGVLISIHTPLAGSDRQPAQAGTRGESFQSTLPLRGVTTDRHDIIRRQVISIHTPLAGSDPS